MTVRLFPFLPQLEVICLNSKWTWGFLFYCKCQLFLSIEKYLSWSLCRQTFWGSQMLLILTYVFLQCLLVLSIQYYILWMRGKAILLVISHMSLANHLHHFVQSIFTFTFLVNASFLFLVSLGENSQFFLSNHSWYSADMFYAAEQHRSLLQMELKLKFLRTIRCLHHWPFLQILRSSQSLTFPFPFFFPSLLWFVLINMLSSFYTSGYFF